MSHDLRNRARWLALNGNLAIAPDLYYQGSCVGCLRTIVRDTGAQTGRTFDVIDAARQWLVDHDDECTGSFAIVGFCASVSATRSVSTTRPFGDTLTMLRPSSPVPAATSRFCW